MNAVIPGQWTAITQDTTSNLKCVPVAKNLVIFVVTLIKLLKVPFPFFSVSRPDAARWALHTLWSAWEQASASPSTGRVRVGWIISGRKRRCLQNLDKGLQWFKERFYPSLLVNQGTDSINKCVYIHTGYYLPSIFCVNKWKFHADRYLDNWNASLKPRGED